MAVTEREMELMEEILNLKKENGKLKEENAKIKIQLMYETKERFRIKEEENYKRIKTTLGGNITC